MTKATGLNQNILFSLEMKHLPSFCYKNKMMNVSVSVIELNWSNAIMKTWSKSTDH